MLRSSSRCLTMRISGATSASAACATSRTRSAISRAARARATHGMASGCGSSSCAALRRRSACAACCDATAIPMWRSASRSCRSSAGRAMRSKPPAPPCNWPRRDWNYRAWWRSPRPITQHPGRSSRGSASDSSAWCTTPTTANRACSCLSGEAPPREGGSASAQRAQRRERGLAQVPDRIIDAVDAALILAAEVLPVLGPDFLQLSSACRYRARNERRKVADHEHVGPARAGIAAARIVVVLREEHHALQLGELAQQLEGGGADVAIVLGALVAPSVIGQAAAGHHQADEGDRVAAQLLTERDHDAGRSYAWFQAGVEGARTAADNPHESIRPE